MCATEQKREIFFYNRRFLLVGVVGLVFAASLLFSRSLRPGLPVPTEHQGVGRVLAEIQLQGPTVDRATTESDLKGSIVLLHFWGLWCPPCLRELPLIDSLQSEFKQLTEVRIVSVACGLPGTTPSSEQVRGQAERYLRDRRMELPVYTDRGGMTRRNVAMALGEGMHLAAYPTTLLIDPQGAIRGVWIGYHTGNKQQMAQQVSRLLDPAESNAGQFPE